jgi:CxxH/CxxC protein (TIGR04129 family)
MLNEGDSDASLMYVVCEEHLEQAIDRFVMEFEDAPDIADLTLTTFSAWDPPETCVECGRPARYLVV